MRVGKRTVLVVVGALALAAAPAQAARTAPAGHGSVTRAIAAAERTDAVRRERARHPGVKPQTVETREGIDVQYLHDLDRGTTITVGRDGRVKHVWTGYGAGWVLARGRTIGGTAKALWIWIPLTLAFLVPFADFRRPLSLHNADLAALAAFGIPFALFNHAALAAAMAVSFALLTYLAVRMLMLGTRPPSRAPRLNVPIRWLAGAIVPLCVLRVALDLRSPVQLDVGFFSLLGADRLLHGLPIYGFMPHGGDHYGPVAYAAYAPFQWLLPYTTPAQTDPAAAHWAGIAFDLLTVVGLFVAGSRLGGRRLGAILAYAWVTLPLTLIALCSHANDGLIALLMVCILIALDRPAVVGWLIGLATMAKVAPASLVPLLATHPGVAQVRRAHLVRFGAGLVVACALAAVPVLVHTSPAVLFHSLVAWEPANHTPFSVWGLLDPKAHSYGVYLAQSLGRSAALIMALALALRPQRRTVPQLAALGAAVLIALQLPANYWLFTYASWFIPFVFVALFAPVTAAMPLAPSTAEDHAAVARGRRAPGRARARRSA
jgi:hypothetical protein